MPKYIRRPPLLERLKSYLNPYDLLLWLSEEIESNGWDQLEKEWAIPIAISLNLIFVIARANVGYHSAVYDDVFSDVRGPSLLAWLAAFTVHFLTLFSCANAIYTFSRRKHYRLFENAVDDVPSTPSAHRVRVNSSPAASSPLRLLTSIMGGSTAQSRAHPDPMNEVWELAVWDPLPVGLRLFCYFSPGHAIVYWLFLPTTSNDTRPSTTVATALFLTTLLSFQLSYLQSCFTQQSKDAALISKEVLHEYDTKYVRPRTQPVYRDVGTQFSEKASYSLLRDDQYNTVDTYTPAVVINRGFKPNPNPNYLPHVDPDAKERHIHQQLVSPVLRTPAINSAASSPTKPTSAIRQPVFKPSGDGGSLGIYSHAASPLRKSTSTTFSPPTGSRYLQDIQRERAIKSPLGHPNNAIKRLSVPPDGLGATASDKRSAQLRQEKPRRESGRF